MRIALTIVAAWGASACSFDGSVPASLAGDGGLPGSDATASNVDASTPDAQEDCVLPFILDDRFDNEDLATAGALSIGDGFVAVRNTSGNGSTVEVPEGQLVIRTSSNAEGAAPSFGAASDTSFAFDAANGMTIRLEVSGADIPIWNGIVLGLQSNQASTDSAGGSLMLRVRGSVPHAFTIGMGTNQVNDDPVSEQPYDEAALADGFAITWELQADTWRYKAEGLLTNGQAITDSGSYGANESPADLLDDTLHLGVHIQGTTGDAAQRVLQVRRVALMTGTCP